MLAGDGNAKSGSGRGLSASRVGIAASMAGPMWTFSSWGERAKGGGLMRVTHGLTLASAVLKLSPESG